MPYSEELHCLTDGDPRIRFAGPYAQTELPAILNEIDVLLIPALWPETFSIVTREAVLAGLPVLASRMGGIPDAIEHNVNGILLPPGDVRAWAEAMGRVAQNGNLVAALQRAQLQRGPLKSMEQHAAEIKEMYAEALAASRV
jgi:glycosyltransferase involved in cell wall biosynthesis